MISTKSTRTAPTILVADDDPFFRRLITYQLTKAGYQVLTAQDGRQAIDWLFQSQYKPDLVLLDLLMPQYSGMEVLARIKTLAYKLPVIMVSMAEEHIAREGVNGSGPDLFLKKPFAAGELLASVRSMLLCAQTIERMAAFSQQKAASLTT